MRQSRGVTLLEILLVGFILTFLLAYFLQSYIANQNKRSLISSAMTLVDTLRSAHLYAQTARDRKSWGVVSTDDRNYALISWEPTSDRGSPLTWEVEETNLLNPGIKFSSGFSIYYYADSGDSSGGSISIRGKGEREVIVHVNESGVVTVNEDD